MLPFLLNPVSGEVSYAIDTFIAEYPGVEGLWADSTSQLFVNNAEGEKVVKYNNKGGSKDSVVVAGGAGSSGSDGFSGPATSATFSRSSWMKPAADLTGVLYFTAQEITVRKVDLNGIISLFAGIYTGGSSFDNDVQATSTKLLQLTAIAVDSTGNCYFSERQGGIRWVEKSTGMLRTLISHDSFESGDGGTRTSATVFNTMSMYVRANKLYYTTAECNVHSLDFTTNIVSRVAGNDCVDITGFYYYISHFQSVGDDIQATAANLEITQVTGEHLK